MASSSRKKITISVLIPFLVIMLLFTVMVWQKYRSSQQIPTPLKVEQLEGRRSITLFFADYNESNLVKESREIYPCEGDIECLKSILEELLNGPVGELDETLPDGTVISSVKIENDLATIELNEMFLTAMPSGSSAEMLAVYALINTVSLNFPKIQKVKLNISGNTESMLKHLDLSEPLPPDYSLAETQLLDDKKTSEDVINTKNKGAR